MRSVKSKRLTAEEFHCHYCLVGYHHQGCVYAYGKMKTRTDPRPLRQLSKEERDALLNK